MNSSDFISIDSLKISNENNLYYIEVFIGGPTRRWILKKLLYADMVDIISHHISRRFFYNNPNVIYTDLYNFKYWD